MHIASSFPAAPDSKRLDLQARLSLLARSDVFGNLPEVVLMTLAVSTTELELPRGAPVFRQGDEASALFAVMAGQIRIGVSCADGRGHVFRTLQPGAFFGEVAILDGRRRTADAVAATKCRLLLVDRRHVLNLAASEPCVAFSLMSSLCERLRSTNAQIEGLLFQTLSTRLARVLLKLTIEGTAGEVKAGTGTAGAHRSASVDITQTELSELTGVTRESVNKKLRAWQALGLVALQPGRISLVDRAAIKRLATA